MPAVPYIHTGRPKMPEIMAEISAAHPKQATKLFCCGPAPLVASAMNEASALNRTRPAGARFFAHAEKFEF